MNRESASVLRKISFCRNFDAILGHIMQICLPNLILRFFFIANVRSFAESLDLSSVPKQIRSCLYGCLKKFSNVKYLNMGSGHGGWLSETFCNRFYGLGMEHFTHLVILHFHHDCTDYLLNVIAQNNSQTLRILDFSFSQSVTDSSVQSIVKCGFLQEIDLLGKE